VGGFAHPSYEDRVPVEAFAGRGEAGGAAAALETEARRQFDVWRLFGEWDRQEETLLAAMRELGLPPPSGYGWQRTYRAEVTVEQRLALWQSLHEATIYTVDETTLTG
jgi:hypothetical protein